MYTIYTARANGGEVEEGHYVGIASGFNEARYIVETEGDLCDGLYDCFMIKDYSLYWLLKPNKGGWDFYYSFGSPLVVTEDDLALAWSDFEYDADKDKLERARNTAPNGSYQAIYDAYQSLDGNRSSFNTGYGTFGAGLDGLGLGSSGYGAGGLDFGSGPFDFGSSYSDYF